MAIVQSNYLPWKGYFDLIRRVDEFVLFDTVQYTRRDWRNRNRFKTPAGVRWLTVPVQVKGRYQQRIDETVVSDERWAQRHWDSLVSWYGRAPFFEPYREVLESAYMGMTDLHLSIINRRLLEVVGGLLGISTPLSSATRYMAAGRKSELLLGICQAAGATRYLSGPAARAYLDEELFLDSGVTVEWMSYEGYPEYPQTHPPFDHHVSVLDLLFNVGGEAPKFMLAS